MCQEGRSDVRGGPSVALGAAHSGAERANAQSEVAGFECPLALGVDKREVGGWNREAYRAGFTGHEGEFVEGAQALVVRHYGCHVVRRVEQHGFLAVD